jgi:hypothetical protein
MTLAHEGLEVVDHGAAREELHEATVHRVEGARDGLRTDSRTIGSTTTTTTSAAEIITLSEPKRNDQVQGM